MVVVGLPSVLWSQSQMFSEAGGFGRTTQGPCLLFHGSKVAGSEHHGPMVSLPSTQWSRSEIFSEAGASGGRHRDCACHFRAVNGYPYSWHWVGMPPTAEVTLPPQHHAPEPWSGRSVGVFGRRRL
jgi:hypothetical protein